jgi:hypothetical protein
MAIDPRISLGVQQLQLNDPLTQYGQTQNILAAQAQQRAAGTQQQAAQLNLAQLQRSADYVNKMQEAIRKNGGPLDIKVAAQMLTENPDTNISLHGYQLLQGIKDKELFEDYVRGQKPNALTTPAAAPAVAAAAPAAAAPPAAVPPADGSVINSSGSTPVFDRSLENLKAWQADKTTNLDFTDWINQKNTPAAPTPDFAVDPLSRESLANITYQPVKNSAAAVNTLAPAPAAAVNTLAPAPAVQNLPAATTAPGAGQIAKLKQDITALSLMSDPRAKALLTMKENELKTLQTPHVIPNVGLANAAGDVFVKALATPSNATKMMDELDGLPKDSPRRITLINAIQKETQNAPTQLAQMIKERDALQPNDPNRKFYDAAISKTQTEIENQKAHLRIAQKRFDEEFAMGKLSPETIDMMANRYLIDGTLPAIGAGKKGAEAKSQILNRALAISGVTPAQAAANVVQGKQDVAAQAATVKDFASGEASRKVRANNTALNHLETMDKLAGDLANNDIRIVNAASNAFAKATGSSPPANFDAAKQIVANEVMKAVVANGGTGAEREEAGNNIKSSNSPKQLREVLNTYRDLLGGQLSSLQLQYETGSGRKDFESKLTPAARDVVKKANPAPAPAGTSTNKVVDFGSLK